VKTKARFLKTVLIVAAMLLLVPMTFVSAGTPPVPTYGQAVVDCTPDTPVYPLPDPPEWNLNPPPGDWFSDMCASWGCDENHPVTAKLYVRYQCVYPLPDPPAVPDVIVYVLVKAEEGVPIIVNGTVSGTTYDPSFAYVKLQPPNSPRVSGLDDNLCVPTGNPPEFAWINKYDTVIDGGVVTVADGWEASFQTQAGVYTAYAAHTQVYAQGIAQTSGVDGTWIPLDVSYCPPDPTAVTLASFSASPASGDIRLDWQTVSEADNLGFNIYRATAADGPRTRLNADLIPSQVSGDPLNNTYQFVDTAVQPGITYYYWLEDMDMYGISQYQGPVSAVVPSLRRLLPTRPRLAPLPASLRHK
jgi:hypothetical protein